VRGMKFRMKRWGGLAGDGAGAPGGAISSRRKKGQLGVGGRIALGLFFSVFLTVGVVATYAFAVKPWVSVWKARDWMEVKCHILSSEVKESRGSDSTTYSVAIAYVYDVEGQTYEGSRYDFTTGSSSGRKAKKEIVARYREGMEAVCFVNPQNPAESVIERAKVRDWGFGLIPLVFVLIGAGGVLFAIRGPRKPGEEDGRALSVGGRSGSAFRAQAAPGAALHAEDLLAEGSGGGGPVELKPAQPRGLVLGGLIFFALFWNGIVSVFVVNAVGDARGSWVGWIFMLFLLPFVGIGLFLIGLVVRQAMVMTNPLARVTVSRRVLAPGGTLEVSWRFEGARHRLTDVRLWLEGREEATYRRGTDTRTDKETFAELEIATVSGLGSGEPGRATLRLPERTMHSFKADNNRVVWALKLKGGIARWPDVNEEFPVTVAAVAARTDAPVAREEVAS
jgi:hypothetical protein